MPQTKIIFFDIDGTLIDMQKRQVTETMVETLRQLKANGIKICLATGRSPVTVPDFGVAFDAYLTFNGSLCYTQDATIYSRPIPNADVARLVQNAAAIHRPTCAATKDRLVSNGTDVDLDDYFAFAHEKVHIYPDFDDICRQEKIYQLMISCRKSDYDALLQGVSGAEIAAWWDRAVDIIPAGGGKGVGIGKVLAYYGIDKAQALAFGDGNNDIEMLQAVGTGVAMGNASPELKAIADDVCGEVANEGIYHYCKEHNLL